MAIREFYGYDNPTYAALEEPSRKVTSEFGRANHFLDTVKEGVYIEAGLIHTSDYIHNVAHKMLQYLDEFTDILHERHLMTIYPPIGELVEDVRDMDRVFEIVLAILDDVQSALDDFHKAAETNPATRPLALKTEDLMMKVSAEYTGILELALMWEKKPSCSSFDGWVMHKMED